MEYNIELLVKEEKDRINYLLSHALVLEKDIDFNLFKLGILERYDRFIVNLTDDFISYLNGSNIQNL
jgi:hypothetical protein